MFRTHLEYDLKNESLKLANYLRQFIEYKI